MSEEHKTPVELRALKKSLGPWVKIGAAALAGLTSAGGVGIKYFAEMTERQARTETLLISLEKQLGEVRRRQDRPSYVRCPAKAPRGAKYVECELIHGRRDQ